MSRTRPNRPNKCSPRRAGGASHYSCQVSVILQGDVILVCVSFMVITNYVILQTQSFMGRRTGVRIKLGKITWEIVVSS
jgi:hypothetical protein